MVNAIDQLVHSIEVTKKSRLAAPGRTDESGHLPLRDIHVDLVEGLLLAVVEVEINHLEEVGPGLRSNPESRLFPVAEEVCGGCCESIVLIISRYLLRNTTCAVIFAIVTRITNTNDAVQAILT